MQFRPDPYRVLVVSASAKLNTELELLLADGNFEPPVFATNLSQAKEESLRQSYDLVLINAPLPDGYGKDFATRLNESMHCVVLLLEKDEVCLEYGRERTAEGIFSLPKPTNSVLLQQALNWMAAARERLRRSESRVEEEQLLGRAKCLLMERRSMSEQEAHRYIVKESMNHCVPRSETARQILQENR